ncbi:MAG: transposase [Emticicia sp.]|nr:transposase [Emticicia sp.]MDZ7936034.1 transposase [Emticicia sp.]
MKKHNRHSIRLRGYDYSQDGWYFITICVNDFKEVFGEITNNIFTPNKWGTIVETNLKETIEVRGGKTSIDTFQIMPNHLHLIIVIGDKENLPNIAGFPNTDSELTQFGSPISNLGSIIRGIKGRITSQIQLNERVTDLKLWQRNYYEHIIRDANELKRIRKYIENNPYNWQKDKNFFRKLFLKMVKR